MKVWDDLGDRSPSPNTAILKQQLLAFLGKVPCAFPRRLTQKVLIQHFLGEKTVYFTGYRGEYTPF